MSMDTRTRMPFVTGLFKPLSRQARTMILRDRGTLSARTTAAGKTTGHVRTLKHGSSLPGWETCVASFGAKSRRTRGGNVLNCYGSARCSRWWPWCLNGLTGRCGHGTFALLPRCSLVCRCDGPRSRRRCPREPRDSHAFSGSATASTGWQGSAGCLAPVLAIASFAPLLPTTQARRVFTFYLPTEALEAAAAASSETSR